MNLYNTDISKGIEFSNYSIELLKIKSFKIGKRKTALNIGLIFGFQLGHIVLTIWKNN